MQIINNWVHSPNFHSIMNWLPLTLISNFTVSWYGNPLMFHHSSALSNFLEDPWTLKDKSHEQPGTSPQKDRAVIWIHFRPKPVITKHFSLKAVCPPRGAVYDFQREMNRLLDDEEHVKQTKPWELIACWLFIVTMIVTVLSSMQQLVNFLSTGPQHYP